jgi:hypothetical protein
LKLLAKPAAVAACALVLALLSHPAAAGVRGDETGRLLLPLAALLFLTCALLRAFHAPAPERLSATLVALGVALGVAALGYDAVRGHEGRLELAPGGGAVAFEERAPTGTASGLRPLGFDLRLTRLAGDVATLVAETDPPQTVELVRGRAARVEALRLAFAERVSTVRITIGLAQEGRPTQEVEITAGDGAEVSGLFIELERYFPDFALDADNNPFSRSEVPRNPAALLSIHAGERQHRVFVIRALPGLHQVPELPFTFTLNAVAADERLGLAVHEQPAAPLAAAALLLAALGLALGRRS